MIEPKRPEGNDAESLWCQWAHDEIKRLRPMAVSGVQMGNTARGVYHIEIPSEKTKRTIKSSLIWDGTLPFSSSLGVTATFSRADKFGTTITGFPYGNAVDPFNPDKAEWTRDDPVTITVDQAASGVHAGHRFYGWDINPGEVDPGPGITFGIQPDPGQTFTAAPAYIGSVPILTLTPDPDHYATKTGAFNLVARYKQRYVKATGWDASFGSLQPILEAAHFLDQGGVNPNWTFGSFTIGPNPFVGTPVYDWAVYGPGCAWGKTGGSDVTGVYTWYPNATIPPLAGTPLPDITVLNGGFDP